MHPFIALMRRYCNDYTNRHDFSVCPDIMVADYTLHMGRFDLRGRDAQYIPATQRQFAQFPGLCLTVNQLVTNGDRLVMRFSEHGASRRHGGRECSWNGIGLYKWDGARLVENYVEQDYLSRWNQLTAGVPHPVESPAVAPWDTQPEAADPAAEAVVRAMLLDGTLADHPGVLCDDAWLGGPVPRILAPTACRINDLFSAGSHVAFHVTQSGKLLEDFCQDRPALIGREVQLYMAGVVRIAGAGPVWGRVVRNRIDLAKEIAGLAG